MPLQRGEVRGYDFNRMVLEFTMLNQGKVIQCAISTAAMDDLEGRRDVKSDQRVDQFMRLRDAIEERASRKFFEGQAQADRPVVLRSNDFSKLLNSLSSSRAPTGPAGGADHGQLGGITSAPVLGGLHHQYCSI
jgi:hypothetical protein